MSQSISRRSFLKCAGSGAVSLAAALRLAHLALIARLLASVGALALPVGIQEIPQAAGEGAGPVRPEAARLLHPAPVPVRGQRLHDRLHGIL